ncbi:MAG: choice-of-anchor J domain-containing protein [Dysgonamonadaceae bacterium]|jgi:hypothetical protein|nr:choice-of-anchor J domain-containing protein [Dysgonamonadaceae bacterium]
MLKKHLKKSFKAGLFTILCILNNSVLTAQLLPPKALNYERTGKDKIELSWNAPNSDQDYPLYNMTDWIPKSFFYTKQATDTTQHCAISDGKFIYSSSDKNVEGQFMKYDLSGKFIEKITVPGLPAIFKITYDGKYFYGIQYESPGIYQWDMDSRSLVSIIPTPMNLYHICYIPTLDGGNGGFEAGNPLYGYYFKKDGTLLRNGPSYSAYNNCNSTVYYDNRLYAFCPITGSLKAAVEYDVETAQPTGNILDLGSWEGRYGIASSQMALNLSFYEYPLGTMNALMTFLYTTTSDAGTLITSCEIGKRPLPDNLQGYNVYRNDVKQNAMPISPSVYSYKNSGLSEKTDYSYKMTAVYSGTESQVSDILTVRLPETNQLPLIEDFSSGNLAANLWVILPVPTSPAWDVLKTSTIVGKSLPCAAFSYRYSRDYDQTLVSRPLKAPASTIKLRYDVACNPKSLKNEKLNVEINTFEDDTWQTVTSEKSSAVTTIWQLKELDITSYVQNKDFQLRFRVSGDGGSTAYNWYLDNIRVWNPEYFNYAGIVKNIDSPATDVVVKLEKNDDPAVVYSTTTNGTGNFSFNNIEKGTYKLTISKAGKELYVDVAYPVETATASALIIIPGARIQMDANPVNILMGENKKRNIVLPITNTGNADLEWNAVIQYSNLGSGLEIGRNNVSESPAWEIMESFDFSTPREASVVFHKNNYYTIGTIKNYSAKNYDVRKYSLAGQLLQSYQIQIPDEYLALGLVSDGTSLYEVITPISASIPGMLLPIDFENSTVDESRAVKTNFNEVTSLRYAAYDPEHDRFYVGGEHVLYCINRAGQIQQTYDISGSYARNISLDTFGEGGPFVWLYCIKSLPGYGSDSDRASIYKYSLKDGKMANVTKSTIDIPAYETSLAAEPAGLFGTTALIPGYYAIGGAVRFNSSTMVVKTRFFVYKMFPYENWISLQQQTGKIAPETSKDISVNLSSENLNDGDMRQATIIVSSNAQTASVGIPIQLTVDNSGESSCYAPLKPTAVLNENYGVRLTWTMPAAAIQIQGYNVFRNGEKINSGLILLSEFTDSIPGMGNQFYTVNALYNSGCESYESDSTGIMVSNPAIVSAVAGLQASVINKKHVELKWKAPRYGTGFFDNFEPYEAFSISSIGNWTLIDGDKAWTYHDASVTYPHRGEPMAYIVFNPSACTPTSSIVAHDGKKQMLACFGANVNKLSNNDWLISPELDFNRPFTFSFFGKTHSLQYGYEKINIAYSLTGNAPEDFIFVNGNAPLNISNIWWKYEYQIPAEAKYVALNCVTTNGFLLLIDDIYVGHPEYFSDLLGYNIYRNGEKQNTSLLTENSYFDYNVEDGIYMYEVEALFENGTSSKTSANVTVANTYEPTPPRELQASRKDNKIRLSWLPPLWADYTELRYDDGIPDNSFGIADEEQYVGIKWDATDVNVYQGYYITGVQFYIAEPHVYVRPFLIENEDKIRFGEEMQAEIGKYNTYLFDTPVEIKPDAEYIVGYVYMTDNDDHYPVSHDAGPSTSPEKSNLISSDGENWYSAYRLWGEEYNVNWNIAMLVEIKNVEGFYGYNIYRNNVKINAAPLADMKYDDTDDGQRKEYYVTAVYEPSREEKSNVVIVYPVGIELADTNREIKIYPNPAKDRIYIEGNYDSLELVSIEGVKIRDILSKGDKINEVNINYLASGIYMLGAKKGNKMEYYKIIVQNLK